MKLVALTLVALMAPPTLGDGLRAIGTFEPRPQPRDPDFVPSPAPRHGSQADTLEYPPAQLTAAAAAPNRLRATLLLAAGAGLTIAGLLGGRMSTACATRDAQGRCVDARGSADIYPLLTVAGVATAVTGWFWWRQDAPSPGAEP